MNLEFYKSELAEKQRTLRALCERSFTTGNTADIRQNNNAAKIAQLEGEISELKASIARLEGRNA